MKFRLTAIADTDPAWNLQIEHWWNQGGSLLWSQYGGIGSETLDLSEEDCTSFVEKAKQIEGWETFGETLGLEHSISSGKPVSIQVIDEDAVEPEPELELDLESKSSEGSTNYCCRNCGRAWHPGLDPVRDYGMINIPARELNHVLNSLQEAINFSRGEGPNNSSTWEDALAEFVQALGASEAPGSA
jgi:hypothetical protein